MIIFRIALIYIQQQNKTNVFENILNILGKTK